jgi:hypothetical protein
MLQNAGEMAIMWRLPLRTSSERTLVPEIKLVIRWEPVDVCRNSRTVETTECRKHSKHYDNIMQQWFTLAS